MKLINRIFTLFIMVLLVGSCADEPLPYEIYEDLEKGALARKLVDNGGSFFYTNPDISEFTFTVEFYDANDGNNVKSFDWTVRHRNNVAGTTTNPVSMQSVAKSNFGKDSNSGLPTASYAFSMNDALAILGLTIDDVNPGDDIIFDGTITLEDGRTFGPDNSGSAIQGGAGFDGFFRKVLPLICPSDLSGTFDATTTTWCSETYTGQVMFEDDSPGNYKISALHADGTFQEDPTMGAYWACYGDGAGLSGGDILFSDACEKVSITGKDQWSEEFVVNSVTVSGATLTIDWSNTYAPEAGVTTLVRQDGVDWPPLK